MKSSPLFFLGLGVLAVSSSACGPINYYVPEIKIDAQQHIIPVGSKSVRPPAASSYYLFFHTATQRTVVRHIAMQAPNDEARELFYLEAHSDDLERTVKTDQIAADSGSVILSQRTCSYRRPIDTYPSSVQVLVQSATASEAFEVPQLIVEPHPDAALSLTSISIVRFLHADRQILFGAANYEAGGAIGSLQNGTMVNGELQPGSSISLRQAPNFERARLAVGLPSQIEIRDYLRSNRMPLLKTSASPVRTLVILIYGFGKLMRLDSLKDGIVTASRYLSPIGTTEERALDPVCDARFCEQLATGSGTVE